MKPWQYYEITGMDISSVHWTLNTQSATLDVRNIHHPERKNYSPSHLSGKNTLTAFSLYL